MPGRAPGFTSNGDLKGLKDMLNCRVVTNQRMSVIGIATRGNLDRADISERKDRVQDATSGGSLEEFTAGKSNIFPKTFLGIRKMKNP